MGKRGQKHWTTEQAKGVLSEWRASGLAAGAFAKKVGLRRNRLNWWRKRLREWSEEQPPAVTSLKLVPLVPSEVMASPAQMRGAVMMRLPGGIELEFEDAQLSPEWVAALVREVARAR
jgi:hypothetical protein